MRETRPQPRFAAASAGEAVPTSAQVILQTRIDALDITVLKGGGSSVGKWATDNGFRLPPDAPEVLDFYARRSPVFLAARFDADAARSRGLAQGQGTPIHVSIPTPDPWVPLRILALGKQATEFVQADVYLLTDGRPTLLPASDPGVDVARNEPASHSLLSDLRADKGMSWVAPSMWLTYLRLNVPAALLRYDLAVDAHGTGHPSPVAAGLRSLPVPHPSPDSTRALMIAVIAALLVVAGTGFAARRTLARAA